MIKRLVCGCGLAALVLSTPALAADLPVEVVEEARAMWYVSLHGGIKFSEEWNDHLSALCGDLTEAACDEIGDIFENNQKAEDTDLITAEVTVDTDSGLRVGGAVGWQFSGIFAVEAEVGYMWQDFDTYRIHSITSTDADNPEEHSGTVECLASEAFCSGKLDGDLRILTGMINAILGLPVGNFRPYLGFGAGLAHVKLGDVGVGTLDILDDSDVAFAAQGFAGVDFGITEAMAIGVRGRLLHVSNVDVQDNFGFNHELDPDLIKSIEAVLTIGF